MTKTKNKNRRFLLKTAIVKTVFYPFVILIDRVAIVRKFAEKFDTIIKLFGINKSIRFFINYHNYAKWFSNDFKGDKRDNSEVLFIPSQRGANSTFTLANMLFAKYFFDKYGMTTMFLVCDSTVPICSKETYFKKRSNFPFFCRECYHGYSKISKSTGIDIRYFSEFFNNEDNAVWSDEKANISKLGTLDDCLNYTFDDVPIGSIVSKTVLRYFLKGSFSGDNEEVFVFRKFLVASVKQYIVLKKVFINMRIDYSVFDNGTLAFESLVRNLANKNQKPFMTYETFIGDNSLVYKKNNEVMNLSWPVEWSVFQKSFVITEEVKSMVDGFFSNLKSGKDMYAKLNSEHDQSIFKNVKDYVVLFTNLNFDTSVLGKNSLFYNMEDWILSVIDFWQKEVQNLHLIIRIHPAEVKLKSATKEFMTDKIGKAVKSDKIIVVDSVDKVNSYELLKGTKYTLAYASTIGIESSYLGKTCVIAGMPYYRNKDFVITPDSQEEYFNILRLLNKDQYSHTINKDEIISTVYYTYFVRTKRFNKIKFLLPKADKITELKSSKEMIDCNIQFFQDFEKELFDPQINY